MNLCVYVLNVPKDIIDFESRMNFMCSFLRFEPLTHNFGDYILNDSQHVCATISFVELNKQMETKCSGLSELL